MAGGAALSGTAELIEAEVNKRMAEKERQDFIAANKKPGDPDMTALHDFL